MTLYTPSDVDQAADAWGANCGPCALAAVFERPVMEMFDAVAKPPRKMAQQVLVQEEPSYPGYMGIGDIRRAIVRAGGNVGYLESPVIDFIGPIGIVMVEWVGPWEGTRGQATQRHCVATCTGDYADEHALLYVPENHRGVVLAELPTTKRWRWVYDSNVGWAPFELWATKMTAFAMPRRATGWRMSWGCEVLR